MTDAQCHLCHWQLFMLALATLVLLNQVCFLVINMIFSHGYLFGRSWMEKVVGIGSKPYSLSRNFLYLGPRQVDSTLLCLQWQNSAYNYDIQINIDLVKSERRTGKELFPLIYLVKYNLKGCYHTLGAFLAQWKKSVRQVYKCSWSVYYVLGTLLGTVPGIKQ